MDPNEINKLDLEGVQSRSAEIDVELTALEDSESEWTAEGGQQAKHEELSTELGHLAARAKVLNSRAQVRKAAANIANTEKIEMPEISRKQADPYDTRALSFASSPDEVRAAAITAIEKTPHLLDKFKQRATEIVQLHGEPVARRILLTGSEAYRKAYQKGLMGMSSLWTPEEREAFQRAAMSLTDANGGYAVPFVLDPTVISTKDANTNPYRRFSRVETTVGDNWNGITSAGVTASFDAEAAEVSDDSPTLGAAAIQVHMARAFVRASIELTQDWATIEQNLRALIQEAKDDLEGIKFTTGSGSGEPYGIITALDDGSYELDPTTAETFAIADIYKVANALPPKYRLATLDGSDESESRANWIADYSTYNKIRQFDTAGGAGLWEYLGGGRPPKLLGFKAYEVSAMRGFSDIDAAATAENPVLVLGDFRNYVIVDRIGLNIEFIPHLFHTSNNLPSGQRGWFAYWRVGADSVNDAAFRMLDIDTAA